MARSAGDHEPSDSDNGDRDHRNKLGAQNRRQAQRRGADKHLSFGPNVATRIDQIKARDKRRAAKALGKGMGIEVDELEPDGV